MPSALDQYPRGRANLQPTPVEIGQPAPVVQGGGPVERQGVPETGPALQPQQRPNGDQATEAVEDADIQTRRQIATEAAEAARNTAKEDKEKVNEQLNDAFGEDGIEEAYKKALDKLGGEKEVGDLKLSRQDMGMFLMDFGFRAMAYAAQPGGTTGGALGQAGAETLGNVFAEKQRREDAVLSRNEERREAAMDIAKYEVGRQDLEKDAARDPKNIIWTEKGAYNLQTGEYEKGPKGGALQPGMAPGASNRPFAKQFLMDRLAESGFSKEAATAMASGAEHPAQVAAAAREELARAVADGDSIMVGNQRIRARNLTEEQKRRYVQEAVDLVTGYYGSRGPALQQPGPQAEGRQ